ncbi:hypothetical protein [Gluconobacter sp. DsW_058]|uniref:hypothetical protein n=1 Tax=Gluconobacter sp. DsW_058 TaxID=1511210 RepID=UPI000B6DA10A|nr:hypothetical protein [Gluconobacter sp. DsW_058]OUJ09283.1 hypothetical protein HK24_00530 [Gluconobacter sp. DsW_058]
MKINVGSIFRDHFGTLYDSRTNKTSIFDITLFYVLPFVTAGFSYYAGRSFTSDTYNISITFFGIFIALILNIQVAMFSIFQRKWDLPSDTRIATSIANTLADRKRLLIELNANMSYLVLVCCAALVLSLLSYVQSLQSCIISAAMVFLYAHFLLTLLMVVKRAHALFDKEYRDSPN